MSTRVRHCFVAPPVPVGWRRHRPRSTLSREGNGRTRGCAPTALPKCGWLEFAVGADLRVCPTPVPPAPLAGVCLATANCGGGR